MKKRTLGSHCQGFQKKKKKKKRNKREEGGGVPWPAWETDDDHAEMVHTRRRNLNKILIL
jgi:hypothetical protein